MVAIGLVLLVLLYLGNRDGGDEGGSAAPGPTTTLVTAAPSSTTTAAVADPDDPKARDEVAEQDATGDSTAAAQAVLQLADLPEGWERFAGASPDAEICPGHDPLSASAATGSARSAFRRGSDFVVGLVTDFADEADAARMLDLAREAFGACDGYVGQEVLDLGDEATVGRRDASSEGLTSETRVYLARVGSRVAALSVVSFGDLDTDLVRTLVRREVDRL